MWDKDSAGTLRAFIARRKPVWSGVDLRFFQQYKNAPVLEPVPRNQNLSYKKCGWKIWIISFSLSPFEVYFGFKQTL